MLNIVYFISYFLMNISWLTPLSHVILYRYSSVNVNYEKGENRGAKLNKLMIQFTAV